MPASTAAHRCLPLRLCRHHHGRHCRIMRVLLIFILDKVTCVLDMKLKWLAKAEQLKCCVCVCICWCKESSSASSAVAAVVVCLLKEIHGMQFICDEITTMNVALLRG